LKTADRLIEFAGINPAEFFGVTAEVIYDNPNEVKLPTGNIIINNEK
jgi:Mlc titration factor MtfA (ptsG expression regulator)